MGNYGTTPWTSFSYTFLSAGSFTIQAGVRNIRDNSANSVLGLDDVKLSVEQTVTPEPTSLALAGFAGIGMAAGTWRRRRQAKQQAA